ncbi:hypothetical protein DIS24_g8046 [Lasiodiplodia hormozganensis]|uniref:Uncharacterized protein n=1 Tax=Lasiodiplodia hormozganensis TaxID=869390 RepID=A0AA39Y6A3_9PEZI|nr:uncharacterized protein LTHEOB_8517 [Lasiodiplodia theobromae]KAF4541522.1 hypothetical protein LTHEOB_8517 [Lasiodiplodia theobromae]KAK0645285.1 hypothetical protein DIS24_g8046 [Lasiodiplodia hormozganensis]
MEVPNVNSFLPGGEWSWLAVGQIVIGGLGSAVAADALRWACRGGARWAQQKWAALRRRETDVERDA